MLCLQPLGVADGAESLGCDLGEGLAEKRVQLLISRQDSVAELAVTEPMPHSLHRVQFGGVRGQNQERDVHWYVQIVRRMPAGAVEDQHRMTFRSELFAQVSEMHVHEMGVDGWRDQGDRVAGRRTHGREDIRPLVFRLADRGRPRARWCPLPSQSPLLTGTQFILEPDFDLFVAVRIADSLDKKGVLALNVS